MINVLIKETGARETLNIVNQNGVDYIKDFIGNHGAFGDGQFTYDESQDVYVCDKDTFDWWSNVVSANQTLEDRIDSLAKIHGSDAVYDVIAAVHVDLEDHAKTVNAALDDAFGA